MALPLGPQSSDTNFSRHLTRAWIENAGEETIRHFATSRGIDPNQEKKVILDTIFNGREVIRLGRHDRSFRAPATELRLMRQKKIPQKGQILKKGGDRTYQPHKSVILAWNSYYQAGGPALGRQSTEVIDEEGGSSESESELEGAIEGGPVGGSGRGLSRSGAMSLSDMEDALNTTMAEPIPASANSPSGSSSNVNDKAPRPRPLHRTVPASVSLATLNNGEGPEPGDEEERQGSGSPPRTVPVHFAAASHYNSIANSSDVQHGGKPRARGRNGPGGGGGDPSDDDSSSDERPKKGGGNNGGSDNSDDEEEDEDEYEDEEDDDSDDEGNLNDAYFKYPPRPPFDRKDPEWLDKMTGIIRRERGDLLEQYREARDETDKILYQVVAAEEEYEREYERMEEMLKVTGEVAGPKLVDWMRQQTDIEMERWREDMLQEEEAKIAAAVREEMERKAAAEANAEDKGKGKAKEDVMGKGKGKSKASASAGVPNHEEDLPWTRDAIPTDLNGRTHGPPADAAKRSRGGDDNAKADVKGKGKRKMTFPAKDEEDQSWQRDAIPTDIHRRTQAPRMAAAKRSRDYGDDKPADGEPPTMDDKHLDKRARRGEGEPQTLPSSPDQTEDREIKDQPPTQNDTDSQAQPPLAGENAVPQDEDKLPADDKGKNPDTKSRLRSPPPKRPRDDGGNDDDRKDNSMDDETYRLRAAKRLRPIPPSASLPAQPLQPILRKDTKFGYLAPKLQKKVDKSNAHHFREKGAAPPLRRTKARLYSKCTIGQDSDDDGETGESSEKKEENVAGPSTSSAGEGSSTATAEQSRPQVRPLGRTLSRHASTWDVTASSSEEGGPAGHGGPWGIPSQPAGTYTGNGGESSTGGGHVRWHGQLPADFLEAKEAADAQLADAAARVRFQAEAEAAAPAVEQEEEEQSSSGNQVREDDDDEDLYYNPGPVNEPEDKTGPLS